MKTTRNVKGCYTTFIDGEKILIEHGSTGWYAFYIGNNLKLDNLLYDVRTYKTKRELIQNLKAIERLYFS